MTLSRDGKKFIIKNLKPSGYHEVTGRCQDHGHGGGASRQEELESKVKEQATRSRRRYKDLTEREQNTYIVKQLIGEKNWDDRMQFRRDDSLASCYISEIQSFVFGGFTSRFWLLRKHINSMEAKDLDQLPFYAWECLTLRLARRDVNLVIKDQKDMQQIIEFLVISLQTLDGVRGTAKNHIAKSHGIQPHKEPFLQRFKRSFLCCEPNFRQKDIDEVISSDGSYVHEKELYLRVIKWFNLMRARMKISFMALLKQMTIKELFLDSILHVYNKMVNLRLIKNLYPKLDKKFFAKILKGHCNLRILAFKNMQAMGQIKQCKYREYAKVLNDFLSSEITRLVSIDKCVDIFRDFQSTQDDFEELNKQMNSFIHFKFHLLRLLGVLNRLNLITRSQFIRGPHYIACILHRIKIER